MMHIHSIQRTVLTLMACLILSSLSAFGAEDDADRIHKLYMQGLDSLRADLNLAAQTQLTEAQSLCTAYFARTQQHLGDEPLVLQGMAVTQMRLAIYPRARDAMDKAMHLLGNATPRELILNHAMLELYEKAEMRAIKQLIDFGTAHPDQINEALLDLLGTAIARAEADWRDSKKTLIASAREFYLKYNAELEKAHPGERRWGTEWVSAAQYAENEKMLQAKRTEYEDSKQKCAEAQDHVKECEKALAEAKIPVSRTSKQFHREIAAANRALNEAKANFAAQTARMEKLRGEIPYKPSLTKLVPIIPSSPASPQPQTKPTTTPN